MHTEAPNNFPQRLGQGILPDLGVVTEPGPVGSASLPPFDFPNQLVISSAEALLSHKGVKRNITRMWPI